MAEAVTITLLGPPQGKGRARIGRMANGRPVAFTPAATRSYESTLRLAATQAMQGRVPIEGAILLTMVATFPVPASWSRKRRAAALAGEIMPTTKPDADNLLKCCDALNEIVWRDDRQVVQALVQKRYGEQPGVELRVVPA